MIWFLCGVPVVWYLVHRFSRPNDHTPRLERLLSAPVGARDIKPSNTYVWKPVFVNEKALRRFVSTKHVQATAYCNHECGKDSASPGWLHSSLCAARRHFHRCTVHCGVSVEGYIHHEWEHRLICTEYWDAYCRGELTSQGYPNVQD